MPIPRISGSGSGGGGMSPATKVVATGSSGLIADYYTDGVADDIEIQAALDSVSLVGGGSVCLRAGTYIISASLQISSNTMVFGEGWATILKSANNIVFNGILRNKNNTATTGNLKIIIRDLYVDGNKDNIPANNPQDSIWLKYCTDSIVENVYIYNSRDSAIVLDAGASDCLINGNFVDTTWDIGIYNSLSQNTIISNNTVKNSNSYGIRMTRANTNGIQRGYICMGNRVTNCGQGTGFNVDGILTATSGGEENMIVGNYVNGSGRSGIRCVNTGYTLISGNYVLDSDQQGIYLNGAGRGNCTGNVVVCSGRDADNTYSGIYLINAEDWIVSGNRSGGNGNTPRPKYGIEETGTSDNNVIVGNKLDRNGSGGTDGFVVVGTSTEFGHNAT